MCTPPPGYDYLITFFKISLRCYFIRNPVTSVTSSGHHHKPTDKVKAQLYVLKPEEGGAKTPLANYFQVRYGRDYGSTDGLVRCFAL